MNALLLEAGNRSPAVDFDPGTGQFVLQGRSIPENALELFTPILSWVRQYVEQPASNTHLEFKLSYFNSSSTEYLLELFQTLRRVEELGNTFTVRWYRESDDEDMEQIALDFMAMTGMTFEMQTVKPTMSIDADDDLDDI